MKEDQEEEEEEEEEEKQERATPAASCAKVLFRGRLLGEEEHLLFDVDEQASQQQQQLDVLPISGYGWDSGLVVGAGRQIAVNRRYICYCLRPGSVRILGRNVGSRGLFQGHPQRVTDMEFFAETVHLVASASSDGRLLVWRIGEDLGADDKFRLLEQVVLAIQFDGQWKDVQPRVCWHPHSQECLVMCIRDYVLKIDVKEARVKTSHIKFSAETFVNCEMANLIGGVHCIGRHDSEVTDISVFSRDVLYIASASKDGMVRIWGGCEISPLAVFMPHGGQPVGSVTFFSSPSQPDEAVLLTRGTTNNSLKLWVPASSNARLDKSAWQSVQTLEFKSSAEGSAEQAFLSQICIVRQAGLVLIGSSKKHAIYSVHINFGGSSDAVRMDYLAEFSMSMPIISLTAMADIGINCKGIVQVFCVQTQGIQQYFLNISHCLPQCDEPGFVPSSAALVGLEFPKASVSDAVEAEERNERKDLLAKETVEYAAGNLGLACEHNLVTDSGSGFGSWVEVPNWVAATVKKTLKTGSIKEAMDLKDKTLTRPLSPLASGPSLVFMKSHTEEKLMSPHPSTNTSGSCMPTSIRSLSSRRSTVPSIDLQKSKMAEGTVLPAGLVALPVERCHINSQGLKPRSTSITPSELMAMACFEAAAVVADKESKKARQQAANITLQVGSAHSSTEAMTDLHDLESCPGATGVEQFEIPMERHLEQYEPATCSAKSLVFFEKGNHNSPFVVEESAQIRQIVRKQDEEEVIHVSECPGLSMCSNNGMKRKSKSKNTESNRGGESAHGCMGVPKSVLEDTSQACKKGEDVMQGIVAFPDTAQEVMAMQISAMQESFDQLVTSQMELQRNLFAVVGAPLSVETERMDVFLEESTEKCFNAHLDSFWRQLNESKKDRDEFQLELFQHLQRIVTEFLDQEATSTFSNMLKAEVRLFVGSRIGQLISSNVDNVVATALSHNLERCKEKIVKHIEKSLEGMLDLSLGGQLESIWITFLKHLMQDNLCSCFEGRAITKVEGSCANTTEHVHFLLYKGLVPVFGLEEQQLSCASLAANLKDTLISLSSIVSSLMEELQHAEKKAWNRAEYSHIAYDISGELTLLLKEGHLEDAFRLALSLGNISVVSWICKQVDPRTLFASTPPPLSQGVILSLAQQLALELGNDSFHKLAWIEQACLAVNPSEHEFALYMRSSLAQLYVNLQKQLYLFINDAKLTNQARLVMHIINSLMTLCNI